MLLFPIIRQVLEVAKAGQVWNGVLIAKPIKPVYIDNGLPEGQR